MIPKKNKQEIDKLLVFLSYRIIVEYAFQSRKMSEKIRKVFDAEEKSGALAY